MDTIISHYETKKPVVNFNLVGRINKLIEKEKINSIGISIALIMLGTGLASITAALSVSLNSFTILMLATILAMSSNVTAISQRKFKTIVWAFIINIVANVILIGYLLTMTV
tara:strand:+ start:81678 stop:82013 length:336 start_codon:yes stop_codon:yes gene_type:complete